MFCCQRTTFLIGNWAYGVWVEVGQQGTVYKRKHALEFIWVLGESGMPMARHRSDCSYGEWV